MEVHENNGSQNQNRSPSPHPADSPPGPDQPHPPGAPLPQGVNNAAYGPEQQHQYQMAMAALAHAHQQQHPGLPPLPLPYPSAHHLTSLPAHIHGIYQQPHPPQVNAGTRPERRNRKAAAPDEGADGEELGDGSEGSEGDDDSDEWVPPPGSQAEGGEAAAHRTHRRGRRSRGNEHDDGGEDDQNGEPTDSQHHHLQHHPHPHPHGLPPLPPDAHYQLDSQQSLATLGSQSTLPEGSFVLDPHTGIPRAVSSLEDGQGSPKQKRGRKHQNDEEWNKQRKDNHKEVERRRRGNINEGINQLAAIVPNPTGGEKAKGAILSRAVQYIHQLKDNEARNIEKWTLEKLLMDQAMGDLQGQLEELKRRWDMEVQARMAVERELDIYKARAAAGGTENADVGQKRPRVD